jgi:predicted CXXCH cytochrome family protein
MSSPFPRLRASALSGLLLGAVLATLAEAQWPNGVNVTETPHNLTVPAASQASDMRGRIRNYGEVCVYCHSPHEGASWLGSPRAPLWNRPRPNAAYRMPEFSATRMLQDPSPSDRSRLCISCHGGTVGLDGIANLPNSYTGPSAANHLIDECEDCHSGGDPAGGLNWEGVWFREDMRNQHPISVLYDPSLRPGQFKPALGGSVNGLPLYNGKVECATCHEPHSERIKFFLRQSNVGSALCLSCHNTVPSEPVHKS